MILNIYCVKINLFVMKPNVRNDLEAAHGSANPFGDPQNVKEKNDDSSSGVMVPRRGERARNPHSRWREYVKP
jgi:hypothetical protein